MKKSLPTRSISRFLMVLKTVNDDGPVSMMEIAKRTGIPYPTVARLIQTLLRSDLIERLSSTTSYRVTEDVMQLSCGFGDRDRLRKAAREPVAAFTKKAGWPAAVTTRVGRSMTPLVSSHDLTSTRAVCGHATPVLESAPGHVYLAFATEVERECVLVGLSLLNVNLPAIELLRTSSLLADIRARGHATHGASSLAVPIIERGRIAGVITMEFFASMMPMAHAVRRYCDALKSSATRIVMNLEKPDRDLSHSGSEEVLTPRVRRLEQRVQATL